MGVLNKLYVNRDLFSDRNIFNNPDDFKKKLFDIISFYGAFDRDYLLKKAVLLFNLNKREEAVILLIKLIEKTCENNLALVNLGYIISYTNFPIDFLNTVFIKVEKIQNANPDNIPLLKVYLSIYLLLDKDNAAKLIQHQYIEYYIKPRVIEGYKNSIYFYHIPKCSGTSISIAMIKTLYKDPTVSLPDYNTFPLLKYCVEEKIHDFPFLRSQHVNFNDIQHNMEDDKIFSFTILRDPLKRLMSMYRQSVSATFQGFRNLRVIPKYGSNWDYWKAKSVDSWLETVPKSMIQKQLYTFSNDGNIEKAIQNIKKLNYKIAYDYNIGSVDNMFRKIPLKINSSDIPKSLNSSIKSIVISENESVMMRQVLDQEYKFIEAL